MKLIIAFGIIFFYKIISNVIKYFVLSFYKKEYMNYLSDKPEHIQRYKLQIIKMFKDAGVVDVCTPMMQGAGYGHVASVEASVFTNFPSKMEVIAVPALSMFENALGIYRTRAIESFNPVYWVEVIIFFPGRILEYVGLDTDKIAFKLSNILLSFIWWVIGVIFVFCRDDVIDLLRKILGNLE